MKELSIEEKAKAYDEAIEKARIWKDKGGMPKDKQSILNDIFPELRESKDEIIRKSITEFFKTFSKTGTWLAIPDVTKWIAWLEKQEIEPFKAEHGKYYYCIKDYFSNGKKQASKGDVVQALRGLPIMGLKDVSEYFLPINSIKYNPAWSEKDESLYMQIEGVLSVCRTKNLLSFDLYKKMCDLLKSLKYRVQPKQEWSEKDERHLNSIIKRTIAYGDSSIYGLIKDDIDWIKGIEDRVLPQPKQEWSKEDEEHIKSLLERLEGMCKKGATFIRTEFAVSEDEDWLKNLKDRVQPQPKQVWNEEDERMFKSIIALCDEKMKSALYQNVIDHAIDAKKWLKDLKNRVQPQSQWKPSDEQMEALHSIIYIKELSYYGGLKDTLLSFYQNLKKLREE